MKFFATFCLCLAIMSFFITYRISHGEEAPKKADQYWVWDGQSPLDMGKTKPRRVIVNKTSGSQPTYIITDTLPKGTKAINAPSESSGGKP